MNLLKKHKIVIMAGLSLILFYGIYIYIDSRPKSIRTEQIFETNDSKSTIIPSPKSMENIKNSYIQNIVKELSKNFSYIEIVNRLEFNGVNGKYALVEVKYMNNAASCFELYSFLSEKLERLPTSGGFVSVHEILNENEIVFINSTGKHDESNKLDFPYFLRCIRTIEPNGEFNFTGIIEEMYIDIKTPITMGNEPHDILDMDMIPNGIKLTFDMKHNVAFSSIPITESVYDNSKHCLKLLIHQCRFRGKDEKVIPLSNNSYVHKVLAEEKGDHCIIEIYLNDKVDRFNIATYSIEDEKLIFAEVTFKITKDN